MRSGVAFTFTSYDSLRDRLIDFKESVWKKYKDTEHDNLCELLLTAIIRYIKMDASPIFSEENDKILALTGILLEWKNDLNLYWNTFLAHTAPPSKSIFSFYPARTLWSTCKNEESEFLNRMLDYTIGIKKDNPLDDETRKKIKTILETLSEWEQSEAAQSYSDHLNDYDKPAQQNKMG